MYYNMHMVKRIAFFTYLALAVVTPVIMLPFTSELFELNKMVVVYSGALIIGVLLLISWFLPLTHTYTPLPKVLFITLAFFTSVYALSTLLSLDVHMSLFGYYGRFNGGLISILSFAILLVGFTQFIQKKEVLTLIKASIVTAVFVTLWGIPGFFHKDTSCLIFTYTPGTPLLEHIKTSGNGCWVADFRPAERMFSTLGQPNWAGAFLAVHAFLALGYASYMGRQKKHPLWWQLMWGMVTAFLLLGVFLTRSRSAILAVISLLPLVTAFLFVGQKQLRPLATLTFITLLGWVLLFKTGIAPLDAYLPQVKKPASAPSAAPQQATPPSPPTIQVTESFDIRKIVWQGAFNVWKHYPLLGSGPETFALSYYKFRPVEHNYTSEWDYLYNKAHNEFLHYMATIGTLGLLAYVSFIIAVYYLGFVHIFKNREERGLYIAILAAFTAVHISNFFGFSTSTIQLAQFLLPAFLVVLTQKPKERRGNMPPYTFGVLYITLVWCAFITLFLVFSPNPSVRQTFWQSLALASLIPTSLALYSGLHGHKKQLFTTLGAMYGGALVFFLGSGGVWLWALVTAIAAVVVMGVYAKEYGVLGGRTLSHKAAIIAIALLAIVGAHRITAFFKADVAYGQSEVAIAQGDYAKAADLLQRALNLHYEPVYAERFSTLLSSAAPTFGEDERENAEIAVIYSNASLSRILQTSPHNPWFIKTALRNNLAYYETLKDTSYLEAARIFGQLLAEYSPTDPRTFYSIALVYEALAHSQSDLQKRTDYINQAINALNKALELKKDYRDGLFYKAKILSERREKKSSEEAALILDAIVRRDSVDTEALSLLEDIRKLLPKQK